MIYYAITNLAALRLPAASRRYPRWIAVTGLIACAALAFWIERAILLSGLALIAVTLMLALSGGNVLLAVTIGLTVSSPAFSQGSVEFVQVERTQISATPMAA